MLVYQRVTCFHMLFAKYGAGESRLTAGRRKTPVLHTRAPVMAGKRLKEKTKIVET